MSKKSNKSSKPSTKTTKREPRDLDAAIDPEIFERARKIAEQYTVILEPHERLGFLGRSVEMPTVFVDEKTAAKCVRSMREALMVAVAVMLESGQTPPAPASEHMRDAQVNIRLTSEEKMLLERAAKQRGFRGISDFMRSVALSHLRKSA